MTHSPENLFNLEDMGLFIRVVELGGITAAAQCVGIPKSTISRRLRSLEDQLGTRLLERTTRNQHLTELGEAFYQRSLLILDEVATTQKEFSRKQQLPSGRLRIFAPTDFFGLHFRHLLPLFAREYPEITLELFSGAGQLHLLKDRVDIMLHVGNPQDSSYVARKISDCTANYYVGTEYLHNHSEPQTPEELTKHSCIVEMPNPDSTTSRWLFKEDGSTKEVHLRDTHLSDSSYVCLNMVEQGLGISLLPDFVCLEALTENRVKKLFDGRYENTNSFYAIYSSRRYTPSKVKAFLDFLEAHFPKTM